MERNHAWVLVGFALVFGVCFEAFKTPSVDKTRIAGVGKMQALLNEGRAIYDPNAPEERPSRPLQAEEEHEDQSLTDLNTAAPAAPALVAKSAEAAKKDDKKKKKKKKKKADMPPAFAPYMQPPLDSDSKKSQNSDTDSNESLMANTESAPAAPAEAEAIPRTAEEWIRYLLASPDEKRVQKFIQFHQIGVVNDDVYYRVITAMMADARPKMQELGVLALGSSASSKSFLALMTVVSTERLADTAKAQARSYLRSYMRLENLRHLTTILAAGTLSNKAATEEALRLIRMAAEHYLRPSKTPGTNPTTSGQGRASNQQLARHFSPLIPALQNLASRANDTGLRQSASQTVATLNGLLAPLQQPTVPTAQPPSQVAAQSN